MRRVLAALMCTMVLPVAVMAQDDDMYFGKSRRQATKVTIIDTRDVRPSTPDSRPTLQRRGGHTRDVDEYNRRYRHRDNDVDYDYDDDSQSTYYYESGDRGRYYDNEDYYYSTRLSRFYSPGLTISIGSPWYDSFYWDSYYDPFWNMSYYNPWYSYHYTPWGYRMGWSRGWGWTWGYNGWADPYYPYYDRWYGWPYRGYYDYSYSYRPRTVAPRGGTRQGYSHVTSGGRVDYGTRVGATRNGDVTTRRAVTSGSYSGGSRTEGGRVITERYSGSNSNVRVNTNRDNSSPMRSSGSSSGSYSQPTRSSGSTTSSGGSGGGFSGGSRGSRR